MKITDKIKVIEATNFTILPIRDALDKKILKQKCKVEGVMTCKFKLDRKTKKKLFGTRKSRKRAEDKMIDGLCKIYEGFFDRVYNEQGVKL